MSDSSDDENWTPAGFDAKSFREHAQLKKSQTVATVQKEEVQNPLGLSYKELLDRMYKLLKKTAKEKKTLKLTLDIKRESNSKMTLNLREIAASIFRDENQITEFLSARLCVQGSITSTGRLILKGNLQKSQIQDALKRYLELFVVCPTCKGNSNTKIERKNKLDYLVCGDCKGEKYLPNSLVSSEVTNS